MDFKTPTRVWVNQPSIHQTYNKLHGRVGIAYTDNGVTNIYFEKGDLITMEIDPNCLETLNNQVNVFEFSKFKSE